MSTSRIRHDAESRRRYETRTLGAFNLGVETNYEDWFITLRSSSSFAEEDDTDNADITFRNYMKKGPGEPLIGLILSVRISRLMIQV